VLNGVLCVILQVSVSVDSSTQGTFIECVLYSCTTADTGALAVGKSGSGRDESSALSDPTRLSLVHK
jgi:hypothetical protein